MARIDLDGTGISYEIIGDGDMTVAITPGGRSSKDAPGIRTLADALAAGGARVLIWDRPNAGASDIRFEGESESIQSADALSALLRAIGFPPTVLIGGSAGARDSLTTAIRHPGAVSGLFLLWISGGGIGCTTIGWTYTHDSALAALTGGMAAVAALPVWKEQIERNPANRDRFLAHDPMAFFSTMQRWASAFLPADGSPAPGVTAAQLKALRVPVTVLRSGTTDLYHPRAASDAVSALIPRAKLVDPPWGDGEWLERMAGHARGEGYFSRWPLLAPQILAFLDENATRL